MSISTQEFVTSSWKINAVQITIENISDVARWCHGIVMDLGGLHLDRPDGALCIDFISTGSKFFHQRARACIGDWVFCFRDNRFDYRNDKAFKEEFQPVIEADKRQQVLELVTQAMNEARNDFQTHIGWETNENLGPRQIAQEITDMIMGVLR